MEAHDLMEGLEALLKETFPGLPVYTDRLPKDFKRPSLTLELMEQQIQPVNFALVRRQATCLVTCYTTVNGYHDSSRMELNRMQGRLMARCSSPASLAGRSLLPQVNQGEGGVDFATVELAFTWVDARPDYIDEDTAPQALSGVPRMEQFQTNVTGKD